MEEREQRRAKIINFPGGKKKTENKTKVITKSIIGKKFPELENKKQIPNHDSVDDKTFLFQAEREGGYVSDTF